MSTKTKGLCLVGILGLLISLGLASAQWVWAPIGGIGLLSGLTAIANAISEKRS